MIRPYKYLNSDHQKLHEFVMAFFNRIEFETGAFNDRFFDPEFLDIVKRHPKILKKRFKEIYDEIKGWDQSKRSALCQLIRNSNEIENICRGTYKPPVIDQNSTGAMNILRKLFLDLYIQVLDGDGFRDKYKTTLREHFDKFSDLNEDITLCPICGIGELKKREDEARDQYDHYLPKSLYPFSSVNFKNLVPSCIGCNSLEAKGETDTVAVSTGKFFYPFDEHHRGIEMNVDVLRDAPNIKDIEWQIIYTTPDDRNDEIRSWDNIYKIKERHLGFIKARIKKWYELYWTETHSKKMDKLTLIERTESHMNSLKRREELGLSFIERPALEGFLAGAALAQAELEAKRYS